MRAPGVPDCGIAGSHVAIKLCAGNVGSGPILLAFDGTLVDPVVQLGSAHLENLYHLKYLEPQCWQSLL